MCHANVHIDKHRLAMQRLGMTVFSGSLENIFKNISTRSRDWLRENLRYHASLGHAAPDVHIYGKFYRIYRFFVIYLHICKNIYRWSFNEPEYWER